MREVDAMGGEEFSQPTVWMDCTGTFFSRHTTGIQRVVRNLVLAGPLTGVNCRPTGQLAGQWYDLRWNPEADSVNAHEEKPAPPSRCHRLLRGGVNLMKWAGIRFRKAFVSRRVASRVTECIRRVHWRGRYGRAGFRPGDILLLPDATWCYPVPPNYEAIRGAGVKVGLLIHDIIPTTHPQFFGPHLIRVFQDWLANTIPHMDFFIATSQTVCDDLREYVLSRFPDVGFGPESFDWFPMGVALDQKIPTGTVRPHLQSAFCPTTAPGNGNARRRHGAYMMVSTIEPRKNYGLLLDAFERVWQRHPEVRLCLVGREGWLVDDLIGRILRHPQLGRQLFWFNDLSDTELAFAYSHAKAFLFSSFVEGYGLPIAEALQYGLPVFASDTAIHREVAGQFAAYFDPRQPAALANLIEQYEAGQPIPGLRDPSEYQPVDWVTGCRILLQKCHHLSMGPQRRESRRAA